MKIAQYTIGMESQYAYSRQSSRTETLRAWVGDQRPNFEALNGNPQDRATSAKVVISDAARQAAASPSGQADTVSSDKEAEDVAAIQPANENAINDPKLGLLIKIVEALTGKKIKLRKV